MSVFSSPTLRASALAVLLSSTILTGAALAQSGNDASGAPNSSVTMQPNGSTTTTPDTNMPGGNQPMANDSGDSSTGTSNGMHHGDMMHKGAPSPEMMKMHVEQRIKTLHDKMMITSDQESAFGAVATAMRDNEAQMSGIIQDHEANRGKLSAVDSLNSYTKIAQAHVDGLKKVSDAFGTLYGQLSSQQKMVADKLFSQGPEGMHHMHKHMHSKSAQ